MRYESLNDAATNPAVDAGVKPFYAAGGTQVWYMRQSWFADGLLGSTPVINSLESLSATHIKLGSVNTVGAEMIFAMMQGERWSPCGEANGLIRELGLSHTSMLVGDIVVEPDGSVLICRSLDFQRIGEIHVV